MPNVPGLRPTPDRVRETLFNWLGQTLAGTRCLDMFAGSGALGFEALSRGAEYVELVDQSPDVVRVLKEELEIFKADSAAVYLARLPAGLRRPEQPFNIVFLDPPYQENLVLPCCHYLEEKSYLADSALIYLEDRAVIKDNDLPPHWRIIKSKQAGSVFYHLAARETK